MLVALTLSGEGWRVSFGIFAFTYLCVSSAVSVVFLVAFRTLEPFRTSGFYLPLISALGSLLTLQVTVREIWGIENISCVPVFWCSFMWVTLWGLPIVLGTVLHMCCVLLCRQLEKTRKGGEM